MSNTIRDINGNKLRRTLRHAQTHLAGALAWHEDSTGLFVGDYSDAKSRMFVAFVRAENLAEDRYIVAFKKIGEQRNYE